MVNLLTRAIAMVGGLKIADHDYGVIEVANKTGVSISAGKMVYISGFDATLNKPTITLADKDTSAKVAQFITKNAIANNKTGYVYEKMILTGQNTNAGNVSDPVYLGDSGAWTLSAPTGADMVQQIVGFITVKSATVGKILFLLTPRNVVVIGTSGLQGDSITTSKVPASTIIETDIGADVDIKYTVYSAVALSEGDLLHISGFNVANNCFAVEKADGDNKPAQLVAIAANAGATTSLAQMVYSLIDVNTNGSVVGNPVYLDTATAGGWTLTAPSGADQLAQIVGRVKSVNIATGEIEFNLRHGFEGVIGTSMIQNDAITKTKLVGGFSKVTLAAGTGVGANVTIAGIAAGDEVVAVLSFTTAIAIASVVDRTSEYVAGAGVLTKAAGTDETNNQLIVFWNDLT
jgi:hypothetical protein